MNPSEFWKRVSFAMHGSDEVVWVWGTEGDHIVINVKYPVAMKIHLSEKDVKSMRDILKVKEKVKDERDR